ncbi:RNA polymerase sigma factor [Pedobacter sp. MC2016-24]|uniref:RNA polymerase sigma factor n=1 Tax=Pedobacter sp. MC2016-24 TaxID=2780090 RepID=UPI001881745E|nr:sigma-70 family RNA polymerase sigma factor [Pedobacter sp. MC2016-24]MBE9598463.1 sigma-70 family RNA polymerase sigma factor [Pedobacter sp. MC2016-24]
MAAYGTHTDQELLEFMSREDKYAFTELYNRYWKKMLLVAWNHTKDKVNAEDLVHEVFISLWDKRNTQVIENVAAFLTTCVKYSIFKYYQKEKKRAALALANYEFNEIADDDKKLDALFLKDYINGIVEQLPEKCKLTFQYSRVDGLSNAEIAEKMNISEKGVEANLTRALKVVKDNLNHTGLVTLLAPEVVSELYKNIF